jgi:4'-phosphopantetheinyl transferase
MVENMAHERRFQPMWMPSPLATPISPLEAGAIHVWLVTLAEVPTDGAADMLTSDERKQASRFMSASLVRGFIARRAALRQILATYTRTRAADLAFRTGAHGKPQLLDPHGAASTLQFNTSDAGGYALIAVTMQQAIGVDIEAIRQIDDADDIVEQHFSAVERDTYRRLAPEQRPMAFFTAWTRKEAFIKAVGLGLNLSLDAFSVELDPAAPARLIEIDGDPIKAAEWTLLPIEVPRGHVGAVVVGGPISHCQTGIWPPG